MPPPSRTEQALSLALLTLLIVGCIFVLRPFVSAIVWAAILGVTLWPLNVAIRTQLLANRSLAALAVVLLIAVGLIGPFFIVGATLAENAARMGTWLRELIAAGPPGPPDWLERVPLIGRSVAAYWGSFTHDSASLLAELKQFVEPAQRLLVAGGASLLGGLAQLALSILLAFFMFRDGDAMVLRIRAATERLAGARGQRLVAAAASTVQGVVIGILGTAIAQGVLAAIGFWIAGFTAAPLLGFATFLLSPVPIGPPLVWGPAGIYLLTSGETGWGLFVLLWGFLVVSSIDNVVKPLLISRGADLPFILVLLGVLGGVIAFGFIGVFLGPVLLAIGYALLKEWAAVEGEEIVEAPPPEAWAQETRSTSDETIVD